MQVPEIKRIRPAEGCRVIDRFRRGGVITLIIGEQCLISWDNGMSGIFLLSRLECNGIEVQEKKGKK